MERVMIEFLARDKFQLVDGVVPLLRTSILAFPYLIFSS